MAPSHEGARAIIEVVGSLNMDLVTVTPRVPGPGETINATSFATGFGGKGGNQMVAATRMLRDGADAPPSYDQVLVAMHGAVGDDQFGKDFLGHLRDGEQIATDDVVVKEGFKTGTSAILVEEGSGENRILYTKGANGEFSTADAAKLSPVKAGEKHFVVLQLEIPMESSEASILSGIPERELAASPEKAKSFFLEKGVKTLIITLGSEGAYFCSQAESGVVEETIDGHKVKAIDTTAAGDTFVGAYVAHLARSKVQDLAAAISFANLAASKAVTKAGAQASMPYAGELTM